VITIPERHTQTDGQTTYDSNTALCTKVHRAVKNINNKITNNIPENNNKMYCKNKKKNKRTLTAFQMCHDHSVTGF